jgi:hypothetical protein
MASINPNLQKLVLQARSIVPPDHYYALISGSVVASPESAFVHIQDWAFLNGFAYVVESGSSAAAAYDTNVYFIQGSRRKLGILVI